MHSGYFGVKCFLALIGPYMLCSTLQTDSLDMKAPNMTNMTSGSGAQEVIVSNGHTESEPNPFAEYMWMEHEEEYNRQVNVTLKLIRQNLENQTRWAE